MKEDVPAERRAPTPTCTTHAQHGTAHTAQTARGCGRKRPPTRCAQHADRQARDAPSRADRAAAPIAQPRRSDRGPAGGARPAGEGEGEGEGGGRGRRTGLGDGAQLVDQVVLGHAAAAVNQGERLRLLVCDELHLELGGVALACTVRGFKAEWGETTGTRLGGGGVERAAVRGGGGGGRRHAEPSEGRAAVGSDGAYTHPEMARETGREAAREATQLRAADARARTEDGGVRERHEARLVERIRAVGDELTKEDLFLRVERVDDDVHQLVDVRLELELLAGGLLLLARHGRGEERGDRQDDPQSTHLRLPRCLCCC